MSKVYVHALYEKSKASDKRINISIQHRPIWSNIVTLLNLTCCTRLGTLFNDIDPNFDVELVWPPRLTFYKKAAIQLR